MRAFIIISILATLLLSNSDCRKKGNTTKYKGRLEIKGICMNYTISLLEGEMDTSRINSEWTDETTNTTYEDVFGLGSPCTFPIDLKVRDEFYFIIDTPKLDCIVCLAYYPTPPKKLSIKVVDQ